MTVATLPRPPRKRCAGIRALVLALALLVVIGDAGAETRAFLLRGWFGVFSSGIDAMAADLSRRGIRAEAIGHLEWKSAAERIVRERAAGGATRIALVGHSQGANNIIDMARELEKHGIRVDLLVTLAPFLQDPVPPNVLRAVNYYQSPGWGTALSAGPGFAGELRNVDIGSDGGTFHVTIDKNAGVQARVIESIVALTVR